MNEKLSKEKKEVESSGKEGLLSIIAAIMLALLFRSFLYEPFHIPSGSMIPTLLVGDVTFVTKYEYGYSRYSFPFNIARFSGRVWGEDEPKRGEVIVFRMPSRTDINYIKRLIGLPGERVRVRDGIVYINGRQVRKVPTENYVQENAHTGEVQHISQYIETLPNGVSYRVLDHQQGSSEDNTREFVIPEGHYFFMGDNRDNSQDSRFKAVGMVPKENLIGPARTVFFSTAATLWKVWEWFTEIRFSRLFQSIEFDKEEL